MSDNKKKKSIDEKIADALDIDLNNNNNSEEETKQNEILSLIDRAKSHDLGVEFLTNGALDAVAMTFGVHAFVVDAARDELARPSVTIEKPIREITIDPEKREDIEQKSDYNLVRKNLRDIIETGQGAIDGILNVASEGESPRAYEVVSQLIKTVADANRDLLDIHKKMKDLNKENPNSKTQQSAGSITNNAIYVGSTKDLQKLIKDSKSEADTIDAEYEVIEDVEPRK